MNATTRTALPHRTSIGKLKSRQQNENRKIKQNVSTWHSIVRWAKQIKNHICAGVYRFPVTLKQIDFFLSKILRTMAPPTTNKKETRDTHKHKLALVTLICFQQCHCTRNSQFECAWFSNQMWLVGVCGASKPLRSASHVCDGVRSSMWKRTANSSENRRWWCYRFWCRNDNENHLQIYCHHTITIIWSEISIKSSPKNRSISHAIIRQRSKSICQWSQWCDARENIRKINLFSYKFRTMSVWRGGYAYAIIITNIHSHTKWNEKKKSEHCAYRVRTGKRKTFAHKLIEFYRIRSRCTHTHFNQHTASKIKCGRYLRKEKKNRLELDFFLDRRRFPIHSVKYYLWLLHFIKNHKRTQHKERTKTKTRWASSL